MKKQFTVREAQRIRGLVKKGKTQYQIARALKTRKQNIATFLRKAKIGVRVTTGATQYWKDVKTVMKTTDTTRSEASEFVKRSKKWASKRAARAGKHWSEISKRQKWWKIWKAKYKQATLLEKNELKKDAQKWKDTEHYGDTPH